MTEELESKKADITRKSEAAFDLSEEIREAIEVMCAEQGYDDAIISQGCGWDADSVYGKVTVRIERYIAPPMD